MSSGTVASQRTNTRGSLCVVAGKKDKRKGGGGAKPAGGGGAGGGAKTGGNQGHKSPGKVKEGSAYQTETRKIITHCRSCGAEESRYGNCRWPDCNEQIFVCPDCRGTHGLFCGEACREAAAGAGIPVVPPPEIPV